MIAPGKSLLYAVTFAGTQHSYAQLIADTNDYSIRQVLGDKMWYYIAISVTE